MANFWKNKKIRIAALLLAVLVLLYGMGRLYYQVTGGFTIGNITYEHPYDPRWDVSPLTASEDKQVRDALSQPYNYLGKGCQSYVFASADGHYVIKFFKYQRFRPQEWLDYFAFIPWVNTYRLGKIEKKKRKLENVYTSWITAYEQLKPETGVVFVHLNKSKDLQTKLTIHDKMGFSHELDLDRYEFLLQKRASMLCTTIDELMANQKEDEAKQILDRLLAMLLFEYSRSYADNDHALMQNTGVSNGQPIHIDVGQFVHNPIVQDPTVYHQELFSKMYKFRLWLDKNHPSLKTYLDGLLYQIMGDKLWTLKPELNKASMGRIPNT